MSNIDKFTNLTAEYYKNIGPCHHKDRDCHFNILHTYSYGEPPYWEIHHYGYLDDLPTELANVKFKTYDDALSAFIEWFEPIVKESKEYKSYDEVW